MHRTNDAQNRRPPSRLAVPVGCPQRKFSSGFSQTNDQRGGFVAETPRGRQVADDRDRVEVVQFSLSLS